MWCRIRLLHAMAAALYVLGFTGPALAESPMPIQSYKKLTPNNQFVFVMLAPDSEETEVILSALSEERAASIRELRRMYGRSGMYCNDGSTEPLWTVDWYAPRVDLTDDGVHLVRTNEGAVRFYANGRLLRLYWGEELAPNAQRLVSMTGIYLMWRKESQLSGKFEYTITTLDGNRFLFDVRSGEIVTEPLSPEVESESSEPTSDRAPRWGLWVVLGVVAIGTVVAFLMWRRSRPPRTPAEPGAGPPAPDSSQPGVIPVTPG
jgi:hypothetical protein